MKEACFYCDLNVFGLLHFMHCRQTIWEVHTEVERTIREALSEFLPNALIFDSFLSLQYKYTKLCEEHPNTFKVRDTDVTNDSLQSRCID